MNVTEFLRRQNVTFELIEHPDAYTAMELAECIHTTGKMVAKTVLLRVGDGYVIAVVPSTHLVDLSAVKTLLHERQVAVATEDEMHDHFPELERGIVPPFGSQYGMRTVLDVHLCGCTSLVFEADNHHEAFRIAVDDFQMIESPLRGLISRPVGRSRRQIEEWSHAAADI